MWVIAIYILLIFLQLLFGYGCDLLFSNPGGKKSLINLSAYSFAVVEYSIFAFLLYKFIYFPFVKIYLIISSMLFTITAILLWCSNLSYPKANSIVTTIES